MSWFYLYSSYLPVQTIRLVGQVILHPQKVFVKLRQQREQTTNRLSSEQSRSPVLILACFSESAGLRSSSIFLLETGQVQLSSSLVFAKNWWYIVGEHLGAVLWSMDRVETLGLYLLNVQWELLDEMISCIIAQKGKHS